jgi:antitoxin (DNA-binding transcriptional repressor) of toxin-antitoxin stability system
VRAASKKSVGLRELKNGLSAYVRKVRAGESFLITDRGEVVAEINPPGQAASRDDVPPGLAELARQGLVTLGGPNDPSLYPRMPRFLKRFTAAELLDQERGER